MSEIDPEKLAAALCYADSNWDSRAETLLVKAAARAHLATLPRFKEVEVVRWAAFQSDGTCLGTWDNQGAAHGVLRSYPRGYVVRLTGTAKVKVTP